MKGGLASQEIYFSDILYTKGYPFNGYASRSDTWLLTNLSMDLPIMSGEENDCSKVLYKEFCCRTENLALLNDPELERRKDSMQDLKKGKEEAAKTRIMIVLPVM